MNLPDVHEVTSLIVAAIAPHVTYKNHDAEIAVMFAIRDAVQADRDQHAKHIAEMATPLLSHTRVEWIEGRPHKVTISSPAPTPAKTSSTHHAARGR